MPGGRFAAFEQPLGKVATRTQLGHGHVDRADMGNESPRVLWRVWFPERMMIIPAQRKYPRELKEGAVQPVVEARKGVPNLPVTAAVKRIGARTGVNAGTLRGWFKQAEIDTGQRPGTTTADVTKDQAA